MEPKRHFRKRWLWASLNVAGMVLVLKVGSALWVPPGEEGMPGGPGDAFSFFFAVVPILVAFLLLDVAALAWILVIERGAMNSVSWDDLHDGSVQRVVFLGRQSATTPETDVQRSFS